jgi:hypothetical protein
VDARLDARDVAAVIDIAADIATRRWSGETKARRSRDATKAGRRAGRARAG